MGPTHPTSDGDESAGLSGDASTSQLMFSTESEVPIRVPFDSPADGER